MPSPSCTPVTLSFFFLITAAVASPAFGQSSTPSLTGRVSSDGVLSGGHPQLIHADLAASADATGPVQVTFDARNVARNKFITPMSATGYTADSNPCPAGHQCFSGEVARDPFAPVGRQSIALTATTAAGRRIDGSVAVDVAALVDRDSDGLPDIWEGDYGLDAVPPSGAEGVHGRNGDPDADGVSNIEEFRNHTRAHAISACSPRRPTARRSRCPRASS